VSLICGSIAAANASVVKTVPALKLVASIAGLHISGFLFGYLASRFLGTPEAKARTISIETGIYVIV
jgi:BASS family bile acid:Na+ symporter